MTTYYKLFKQENDVPVDRLINDWLDSSMAEPAGPVVLCADLGVLWAMLPYKAAAEALSSPPAPRKEPPRRQELLEMPSERAEVMAAKPPPDKVRIPVIEASREVNGRRERVEAMAGVFCVPPGEKYHPDDAEPAPVPAAYEAL